MSATLVESRIEKRDTYSVTVQVCTNESLTSPTIRPIPNLLHAQPQASLQTAVQWQKHCCIIFRQNGCFSLQRTRAECSQSGQMLGIGPRNLDLKCVS